MHFFFIVIVTLRNDNQRLAQGPSPAAPWGSLLWALEHLPVFQDNRNNNNNKHHCKCIVEFTVTLSH